MFQLSDLARRIIVAPMAGGASTPELVAAASAAGGMGFLAAGHKDVVTVEDQVKAVRALDHGPFGVNLFVPDAEPADLEAARRYRDQLAPLAERYGIELPEPRQDDDGWSQKVEALLDLEVPAVSFTFGPAGATCRRAPRLTSWPGSPAEARRPHRLGRAIPATSPIRAGRIQPKPSSKPGSTPPAADAADATPAGTPTCVASRKSSETTPAPSMVRR